MKKASAEFEKVDRPQEALLDARLFRTCTNLTKSQVETLSANAQKFNVTEFTDKVLAKFGNSRNHFNNFRRIGERFGFSLARAPPLQYLNGSIDSVPNLPKEKKPRQARKSLGELGKSFLVHFYSNENKDTGIF